MQSLQQQQQQQQSQNSNVQYMQVLNLASYCSQKNIDAKALSQQQQIQVFTAYKHYYNMAMRYNYEVKRLQAWSQQQNQIQKMQEQSIKSVLKSKKQRKIRPPVPKFFEEKSGNEMTFDMPAFEECKSQEKEESKIEESVKLEMELINEEEDSTDTSSTSQDSQQNKQQNKQIQYETSQQQSVQFANKKMQQKMQVLLEHVEEILSTMNCKNKALYDKVIYICRSVIPQESDFLKNRSFQTIAAAIIIHASRLVGAPLTTRKVSKYIDCKERTLNKIFNLLRQHYEVLQDNKRSSPLMFVGKTATNLNIQNNQEILQTTQFLIQQMEQLPQIQGQQAGTIAACAVKVACFLHGKDFSFKQITDASDVCQISIRNCFSVTAPLINQILNNKGCPQSIIVNPRFLQKQCVSSC